MSNRTDYHLNNPDPLSILVAKLDLSAEVYVNGNFCGNWAVDTSGSRRIPFHLIAQGEAWLHVEGEEAKRIATGDMVLFPHDHQHIMSSDSQRPLLELVNTGLGDSEEGQITNMICGFFEFKNKASWPLLDSLSEVIHLDLTYLSQAPAIRALLDLLIAELQREEAGYYAYINQIAFLLFIEIVRQQIKQGHVEGGLLAALFDKKLSLALKGIHQSPEYNWTLERLANEAGMGRSTFSQHFHKTVGLPAMQYLSEWRMSIAAQLLQETNRSMFDIAESVGYQSDAAFRKAFKKIVGETPGTVRKRVSV